MNVKGIAAGLAAGASVTALASVGQHDSAINGFFHDVQLIVAGLKGLIEPIGALLLAGSLVLQTIIMRNQKKSSTERKDQNAVLSAQTDTLETIKNDVSTVKDVQITTALMSPNKEEGT